MSTSGWRAYYTRIKQEMAPGPECTCYECLSRFEERDQVLHGIHYMAGRKPREYGQRDDRWFLTPQSYATSLFQEDLHPAKMVPVGPEELYLTPLTNGNNVLKSQEEWDNYPHVPARCGRGNYHPNGVPEATCGCGHHAYYAPEAALKLEQEYGGRYGRDGEPKLVLLTKVEAYGKVVHCKHHFGKASGWRSEFVKVAAVVSPTCMYGHVATKVVRTEFTSKYRSSVPEVALDYDCGALHLLAARQEGYTLKDYKEWDLTGMIQRMANRLDCDIWAPDSGEIGVVKGHISAKEQEMEHRYLLEQFAGQEGFGYGPRTNWWEPKDSISLTSTGLDFTFTVKEYND